jgi:predicted MFS family arabinose efflux permease
VFVRALRRVLRGTPLATDAMFRRYWLGRLGSYAGDQIARTALLIAVFDTHGARALGWLLLAGTAPRLLGPVLGTLADRFDQRRLMVGCDIAQAAIYLLLAVLVPALPAIVVLTAAGTTLATVFTPAGRCLVPRMVGMDRLPAANAQLALAVNAGIAAGPLLGGLLFAAIGLRGTLLVNAATFVLSAALLSARGFRSAAAPAVARDRAADSPGVPVGSGLAPAAVPPGSAVVATVHPVPEESILDDLRAGLRVVWSTPVVRAISLTLLGSVVFAALDNVAVVPFGLRTLHVDEAVVGLLGTAYGVGMAVAPMLLMMRRGYRPERLLLFALLGFGGGTVLTAVSPVLGLALCGQALAGAGNGWENVATDTLIQRGAPQDRQGAVFGTVYTAPYAAEVIAYAIGGPLLAMMGPRWVLMLAGVGVLATAAVGYPAVVRARNRAAPPATDPLPQTT